MTTTSLNRLMMCAALACAGITYAAQPAKAGIACPPTHNGKPLVDVELFEGDPSDLASIMDVNGGFIIPELGGIKWKGDPYYSLGCIYKGSKEIIPVKLPKNILICKFVKYPKVSCE